MRGVEPTVKKTGHDIYLFQNNRAETVGKKNTKVNYQQPHFKQ